MFRPSRFSITKKLLVVFVGFGIVVAGLGGLALLAVKGAGRYAGGDADRRADFFA